MALKTVYVVYYSYDCEYNQVVGLVQNGQDIVPKTQKRKTRVYGKKQFETREDLQKWIEEFLDKQENAEWWIQEKTIVVRIR